MKYLLARLLEPSTWAGLTGAALALGTDPDVMHEIAQAGVAIASLVAITLPEGGQRGRPDEVSHP